MTDTSTLKQTEALYETLAGMIDAVRAQGADDAVASEMEAQFLAKLSFLALREIGDPESQRALMERAARDLG